jgi:hypothetical protein
MEHGFMHLFYERTPAHVHLDGTIPINLYRDDGDLAITMPESSGDGQVMELEQSGYHAVREEAVVSIEKTIAELGQMFQHFAGLVAEQGDLVQRIDSDIEDTVANVDAGQSELLKYYKSISSNRWLIFKVFIVLVLFVVFFTTVVL